MHDDAHLWMDLVLEDRTRGRLDVEAVMNNSEMQGVLGALQVSPSNSCATCQWAKLSTITRKRPAAENRTGQGGRAKGVGMTCMRARKTSCVGQWLSSCQRTSGREAPRESVWGRFRGRRKEYKARVWEAGVDVTERILGVLVDQKLGKWIETRQMDRNKERPDELIKEGGLNCAAQILTPPPQTSGEDAVVCSPCNAFIPEDDNSILFLPGCVDAGIERCCMQPPLGEMIFNMHTSTSRGDGIYTVTSGGSPMDKLCRDRQTPTTTQCTRRLPASSRPSGLRPQASGLRDLQRRESFTVERHSKQISSLTYIAPPSPPCHPVWAAMSAILKP
ncbi:hypothetical protein V8D89_004236 [Ganoderma adspersum]